jgi:hypothetical protein
MASDNSRRSARAGCSALKDLLPSFSFCSWSVGIPCRFLVLLSCNIAVELSRVYASGTLSVNILRTQSRNRSCNSTLQVASDTCARRRIPPPYPLMGTSPSCRYTLLHTGSKIGNTERDTIYCWIDYRLSIKLYVRCERLNISLNFTI